MVSMTLNLCWLDVRGMFLITDQDRGMFVIIYSPSKGNPVFVNLSAEYGVQRFTGLVAGQWTLEEGDQAALMGNH